MLHSTHQIISQVQAIICRRRMVYNSDHNTTITTRQWWRQRGSGEGLQPPCRGVLAPPPPVGEILYICRRKLTKIWPNVPNHEKKYSPPVREHSPSVGKFLAPPLPRGKGCGEILTHKTSALSGSQNREIIQILPFF